MYEQDKNTWDIWQVETNNSIFLLTHEHLSKNINTFLNPYKISLLDLFFNINNLMEK